MRYESSKCENKQIKSPDWFPFDEAFQLDPKSLVVCDRSYPVSDWLAGPLNEWLTGAMTN